MNDNIFCLGIKIINFACMISGTADGLFNLNKLLLELKQAARMPINLLFPCGRAGDSCESLEHHWEVISLLGNDFVNFVCLPLLLPIHSMATQAKIFMMGKNRDFTPRSLFKAKQSTGISTSSSKTTS